MNEKKVAKIKATAKKKNVIKIMLKNLNIEKSQVSKKNLDGQRYYK